MSRKYLILTYLALLEWFVNPSKVLPQRGVVIIFDTVVRPIEQWGLGSIFYVTGVQKFNTIKAISYYISTTYSKESWVISAKNISLTYLPCSSFAISAHLFPNFLWASKMTFSSALVIGSLLISGSKWLCHLYEKGWVSEWSVINII